ncbi:MAG: long-chain-acyl-CoA synthetase [Myxococcales bacterium]|nr:long-chain-acyl-CoA synthetase [Myxococcales bacterium]MDD9969290.1 long-chain-acyl-CoA synthetase [Myxococcales bacterium]
MWALLPPLLRAVFRFAFGPKTLSQALEEHAAGHRAQHILLRFEELTFTFAQANGLVNRYADAYRSIGLKKGDTLALLMENRPSFLWHYLAAGKLGVTISLVNSHNTGVPLLHSIRVCEPKLVMVGSELWPAFAAVRSELPDGLRVLVDEDVEYPVPSHLPVDVPAWGPCLETASEDNPPETGLQGRKDVAAYIYTSGTTGMPKAAVIRHQRAVVAGLAASLGFPVSGDSVVYCCLPLYHSNGLMLATGSNIVAGGTLALARRFSAHRFWDDIRHHGATSFIYIGELCRYLMNVAPGPDDRRHAVRRVMGNGLRPDIWSEFQERFGVERVVEFYASTEGNVSSANLAGPVGSVGKLSRLGALVRWDERAEDFVRGPEGFMVRCKPGEAGILLGRIGRIPFDGYRDEAATQKKILRDVFAKGDQWFNTGDLLRIDSKKYLYFVDRLGDTYRWKGENVSTFEVQEQISSWPVASEVNVYGVHVEGTEGRAGMASVVLDEQAQFDAGSFKQHVDSSLPGYARPLFVRVSRALDTTGTLKLKKNDLRDEGFDPKIVEDPLYFRHPDEDRYVEMTEQLYADVVSGKLRL